MKRRASIKSLPERKAKRRPADREPDKSIPPEVIIPGEPCTHAFVRAESPTSESCDGDAPGPSSSTHKNQDTGSGSRHRVEQSPSGNSQPLPEDSKQHTSTLSASRDENLSMASPSSSAPCSSGSSNSFKGTKFGDSKKPPKKRAVISDDSLNDSYTTLSRTESTLSRTVSPQSSPYNSSSYSPVSDYGLDHRSTSTETLAGDSSLSSFSDNSDIVIIKTSSVSAVAGMPETDSVSESYDIIVTDVHSCADDTCSNEDADAHSSRMTVVSAVKENFSNQRPVPMNDGEESVDTFMSSATSALLSLQSSRGAVVKDEPRSADREDSDDEDDGKHVYPPAETTQAGGATDDEEVEPTSNGSESNGKGTMAVDTAEMIGERVRCKIDPEQTSSSQSEKVSKNRADFTPETCESSIVSFDNTAQKNPCLPVSEETAHEGSDTNASSSATGAKDLKYRTSRSSRTTSPALKPNAIPQQNSSADSAINSQIGLQSSQRNSNIQGIPEVENLDAVQLATELVQTYGGSNAHRIPEILNPSSVQAPDYSYQDQPANPNIQYQHYQQDPQSAPDRIAYQHSLPSHGSRPQYDELPSDKRLFHSQQYGNYPPPDTFSAFHKTGSANYTVEQQHPEVSPGRYRGDPASGFAPAGFNGPRTYSDVPMAPGSWSTAGNPSAQTVEHPQHMRASGSGYPGDANVNPAQASRGNSHPVFYKSPTDIAREQRFRQTPDVTTMTYTTRALMESHLNTPYQNTRPMQLGNYPPIPTAFSDINYSSIYPSKDFIEKSTRTFMAEQESPRVLDQEPPSHQQHSVRPTRQSVRKSYSDPQLPEMPSTYQDTCTPTPQAGQKYFVVNPSDAKTMDPKALLSRYIDFLVLENEQVTEISKSMSVPVDIYVTEDMYFMDTLKSRVPFPSEKFHEWVRSFYPKLNLSEMKFQGMYPTGIKCPLQENEEDKPTQQVLEDIFYFFQREIMNTT